MSRTCDVMCAADHVVRFTRPSPSVFAYCKRSKTGAGEGLGTRLYSTAPHHGLAVAMDSAKSQQIGRCAKLV